MRVAPPLFLALVGTLAVGACAPKIRQAPQCSVPSCCGSGGYVYEPAQGCIPANAPPHCGCVCKGDPPYPTKAACEEDVARAGR